MLFTVILTSVLFFVINIFSGFGLRRILMDQWFTCLTFNNLRKFIIIIIIIIKIIIIIIIVISNLKLLFCFIFIGFGTSFTLKSPICSIYVLNFMLITYKNIFINFLNIIILFILNTETVITQLHNHFKRTKESHLIRKLLSNTFGQIEVFFYLLKKFFI
jgi:hypothetical protein